MEIKPMYDNTIKMNVKTLDLGSPDIVKKKVETGIPNGIYGVIRWEKLRQLYTLGVSGAFVITSIVLMILYSTVMDVSWIAYTVPITLLILTGWKMLTTYFERKRLIKDVDRFKEDLKIGLDSTPPFIARLYQALHVKQVAHNWMTMTIMFYGGISTLLLWWLKDTSWWIFDFKTWIGNMFSSPTTMAWLFTILLITVAVIHVIFAIQRNKRILDINSYFGAALASQAEIETIKQSRNKMYRRLFIISVMVVLIIPIVIKFIMKVFKKK